MRLNDVEIVSLIVCIYSAFVCFFYQVAPYTHRLWQISLLWWRWEQFGHLIFFIDHHVSIDFELYCCIMLYKCGAYCSSFVTVFHCVRMCCLLWNHTVPSFYTVSQKNDTDVAHYYFNAHQPILVILAEVLLKE